MFSKKTTTLELFGLGISRKAKKKKVRTAFELNQLDTTICLPMETFPIQKMQKINIPHPQLLPSNCSKNISSLLDRRLLGDHIEHHIKISCKTNAVMISFSSPRHCKVVHDITKYNYILKYYTGSYLSTSLISSRERLRLLK